MKPSKNPNADQKAFQKAIRFVGCPITGERYQLQLHHVVGRSAVYNKVHIGHWFVLPLHVTLHERQMNHPNNVTDHPEKFTKAYGTQVMLFLKCLDSIYEAAESGLIKLPPMPDTTIIGAIKLTSK